MRLMLVRVANSRMGVPPFGFLAGYCEADNWLAQWPLAEGVQLGSNGL